MWQIDANSTCAPISSFRKRTFTNSHLTCKPASKCWKCGIGAVRVPELLAADNGLSSFNCSFSCVCERVVLFGSELCRNTKIRILFNEYQNCGDEENNNEIREEVRSEIFWAFSIRFIRMKWNDKCYFRFRIFFPSSSQSKWQLWHSFNSILLKSQERNLFHFMHREARVFCPLSIASLRSD